MKKEQIEVIKKDLVAHFKKLLDEAPFKEDIADITTLMALNSIPVVFGIANIAGFITILKALKERHCEGSKEITTVTIYFAEELLKGNREKFQIVDRGFEEAINDLKKLQQ